MSLNIYVKEDVTQSIIAVAIAMLSSAIAHGGDNIEYVRGVLDTSRAQALNYGVWYKVKDALKRELDTGIFALLENTVI